MTHNPEGARFTATVFKCFGWGLFVLGAVSIAVIVGEMTQHQAPVADRIAVAVGGGVYLLQWSLDQWNARTRAEFIPASNGSNYVATRS